MAKRYRLGRLLGLLSLCAVLILGCTQTSPPNGMTGATADRIVVGTTTKVRTLDPADANEVFAGTVLNNIGERLYTYASGTGTLVPQLASALPIVSADGLTYKIPLRQGVLFHDGTQFNAKAMVFSLQRFIENGGKPSSLLAGRVDSIQATGDYELQIRLKKPFVAFPSLLAFSGLCAVSPQAYIVGKGKFNSDRFVGTGPYELVQVRSDSIRLRPFAEYWDKTKLPRNPGIDIQVFSSGANLYNAFRTGAVDVATQSLQPNQISALSQQAKKQGWQVVSGLGNVINVLVVNLRQPPWDKQEARQALAALINREILGSRVFQGQVDPLYSLIPTIFSDSQPIFEQLYGQGQVAQGTKFLDRAGFSASKPLDIDLWYRSNVPSNVLVAVTLKAAMERDWGNQVRVQLSSVESTTAYNNLDKGVYPLMILDWYGDFYDPDNYIEPFLACDKGTAQTGCEEGQSALWGSFFYDPEANRLIDQQRQEANPQRRKEILAHLQKILGEQVPFIPLWQSKGYIFARANIQGVKLEPTQQFSFSTLKKS